MVAVLDQIGTVLVTGASSGIGETFARRLAEMGKNLILVARSQDRLEALARELSAAYGIQAHVIVADLARPSAAQIVYAKTEGMGWTVDLLINNAGFSKAGDFTELSLDVQADMVRLNVNTLMELSRLYLPAMRARRRGGIIQVASNAAFQPVPYMSVYAATKAFVLRLSEALAEEVRREGVTVMALCPGATATGFWEVAGLWSRHQGWMHTPERVVDTALRGFERRKLWVTPGLGFRLVAFVASRLAPQRVVTRVAARIVGGRPLLRWMPS
jgi:short-subunit dehydrogenase